MRGNPSLLNRGMSYFRKLRATFTSGTPGSLLLLLYMRLSGKQLVRTGRCNQCGACCRNINIRTRSGWLKTPEEFEKIKQDYPEYARFTIIEKKDSDLLHFSCSWLQKDAGCRDYHQRLDICRTFPEKSLMFCGGRLPEGCGYTILPATSFDKRLEQAARKKRSR